MFTLHRASVSLSREATENLAVARDRFNRSTANLTEAIAGFSPAPGMMTTAQHVAHVARVIDWFIEGAFRPEGFDTNFEAQIEAVLRVDSLSFARVWFEKSMTDATHLLANQSDAVFMTLLPSGPVLGGMPCFAIIGAIVDHTSHHRGALTVYARLNGIAPPDPYADM